MKNLLAIVFMIICITVNGQPSNESLVIGDKVPDLNFSHVLQYSSSSISLSSLKGKFVILDYWATWCGSCIATFPKLDSLQKKFASDVQFILVNNSKGTGDTKQKVEQFIKNRKSNHQIIPEIPIVVEDKITNLYFPHHYVPHYIWIDPEGKLLAVSKSEFVTKENIENLLKNLTH